MSPHAGRDRWERPSRENREAVDEFIETASRIPADAWNVPLRPGGWTPAQVAEHIVMAYEVFVGQLAGDPPMKRIASPMMQRVLRWFLLPHVLFHRSFPVRAGAPREVTPDGPGIAQDTLEPRLRAASERLDRDIRLTTIAAIPHPYFGRIPIRRALRFIAVHTEHHQRQMERAG
jgi:hypothetical protein